MKSTLKLFVANLRTRSVSANVAYYYVYYFFSGLIFSLPIWVLFYRRIIDFPQLAFLNVFQSIITTVLEIPTGALADLFGKRKTILTGLLVLVASYVGIAFSQTFLHLLIAQIGIGIGSALLSGADSAILYDSLKESGREDDFGKEVVKAGFIYRIGLVLGSFSGGFLYDIWVSLPYLLRSLSVLVGAFAVYRMVEPHIDSNKFSWGNYLKQTREGIREITKSDYIRKLVVYYVIVGGITWSCLYYFAQPFALDFGFSEQQMSLVFGFVYLLTNIILYWVASISTLLTRKRVYLGFPLLMAASFLPAIFAPKFLAPLLILGVQLAGSGRFAILDKYTNKEFEPKNRATANSTLNMLVEIVMILLVLAGGYIQDAYNTKVIYTGLGILTLFLALPFALQLVSENQAYIRRTVRNQ